MPKQKSSFRERAFALIQYPLPQHALSRVWRFASKRHNRWLKNRLIQFIVRRFAVDMSEAVEPDTRAYPTLNAFFTRALKPDARPIAIDNNACVSPADGRISQLGTLTDGQLIQAKGHNYSAAALLGGDATPYQSGRFATIYLSPRDYHRVHMPVTGTLTHMSHIPGRLFSVNPATTQHVPGLFARNERVVMHFDTAHGPMVVVMVGAMLVGSIETVWAGEITPPRGKTVHHWPYAGEVHLEQGAELGRFNMGSTVIVLLPDGGFEWQPQLASNSPVRMGECLGTIA